MFTRHNLLPVAEKDMTHTQLGRMVMYCAISQPL
jgi:hypothetical protein